MKKWDQLKLALDNSKSEKRQGNYWDKIQKFFKRIRVQDIEYQFIWFFI